MNLLCKANNSAQRRYYQGAIGAGLTYCFFFLSATSYVRQSHPQGWHLYLAALLPTISIILFLYVVGRYLREETDEFIRDQFIRSLLWAIAAVMAFAMFISFLRSFGWEGTTKPFTEYFIFCGTLLAAKSIYKRIDRVTTDD